MAAPARRFGATAYRLHSGLRKAGVESSMFVCEARTKDRSIIRFEPTNTFLGRAERRIRRHEIQRKLSPSIHPFSERFEPFRIDRSEFGTDIVSQLPAHDIVNLHGVADFVDYPFFWRAAASGPQRESSGDGLSRASLPLIQGRKPEFIRCRSQRICMKESIPKLKKIMTPDFDVYFAEYDRCRCLVEDAGYCCQLHPSP